MKTMQDYTQYCTKEQTRRAFKLGALLIYYPIFDSSEKCIILNNEFGKQFKAAIPTTQQMINWLREEKGINIEIGHFHYTYDYSVSICINKFDRSIEFHKEYMPYNQAELAAIDAALDYLEKKGGTKK